MAGVGVVCTPGGSVWPRPGSVIAARSAASRRFMVAGDITTNAAATSSLTSRSVPSLGFLRDLLARRYRVATAFVTALRWLNVNPIRSGYRQPERDRRRYANQWAWLREATTPSTRASFVSQRAILTATGRIGRVAVLSKQPTRIGTAANVAGSREYRSPPGHHGDLPRGARYAHNPPARSA